MILLSTLMNDNIDFENTLKIAEKYPNVGLEIFPLWHKTGYDLVLEKYKKRLTQIPISVHEQYYESEHSVDDNDERYAFTTMATKKSIALTKELNGRYMVYHYNNMEVKQEEREKMLFNTRKNLQEVNCMAEEAGIQVVIENVGVPSHKNVIFNEQEFIEECLSMPNPVLIDIGHAYCNGWDLERVILALKDKIIAYHVHNNDGKDDYHKRMHDGTLDFDRFIECYKKYTPHAEIVLEYYIPDEKDLVGIEKDIEELLEKGL